MKYFVNTCWIKYMFDFENWLIFIEFLHIIECHTYFAF